MRWAAVAAALVALGVVPGAAAAATYRNGSVYASVDAAGVTLGNPLAERRWTRTPFRTAALTDKRGRDRAWSAGAPDFTLKLAGGAELSSEQFQLTGVDARRLARGGLRVTMTLRAAWITATRTADAYPGVAGFRTQTTIESATPLALSGATLDQAAAGAGAAPTIHAFRAGADWR